MIRVAYIGNHSVPFTTETYVARALRENGCHVSQIQQERADISDAPGWDVDLVLYTRTHNQTALGPTWTGLWRLLEARGIATASLHLDRFWDLEREHLITGPEPDPLFTTQHVFTADGGDHPWKKYGINHIWLPPAVDRFEAEEMPGRYREELAHDVVFVGSGSTYHGAYPARNALIRFLHDRYGPRFAHYGHGGGLPVVRMQALNDLYASAKVVVGDSCFANGRPEGVTNARYWSDRVPEVLGRGGALVHPWVEGIQDQWPGTVARWHEPGDWENLAWEIDTLLEVPSVAATIREHGSGMARHTHTYTVRVAHLLRTVGLTESTTGMGKDVE